MKFTILAICVAVAAAKPHVYLYNGPAAAPIGSDGRVIDTSEVAFAKATHLAALASASAKASSAETVETGYSYPIPAATYGASKPAVGYQGPPAPLAEDGSVIDTAEVAQLKAERLAALEKANAEAATAEASAAAYAKVHTVYGAPITMAQIQKVPTFIMADPIVAPVHQGYSGPAAPIGRDGRVIDTDEVSKLKAEHLATLAEAQAKATAFAATSSSASSSEGYSYEAPAVTYTQTDTIPAPVAKPQEVYNGPPAPLGKDGRVIDTEEVAKLKAEHLAALDQANAAAAAFAAASGSSMSTFSSEGYTYNAPIVHETESIAIETPVIKPHQVYNGPAAPLGQDGRVIDTEEVAKLKAEHLAALDKANAAAAAFAAASGSSMTTFSSEGYTYVAPTVQHTETLAIDTPVIRPQQIYNGPSAPLGQDGRVIDTEEVAKLKAEHLAALDQANAAAAAFAAATGYTMSSSEGYTYNAPTAVKTQHVYTGPLAPIGQDGRVIDTEEVAKLKAEHLATLEKANAAAAAFAAASGYTMSSSGGYTYSAPAIIKTQPIYTGPLAPIGQDGRVIDTEEVAKLKAEHLATLEKANAAAAAFAAATGYTMSSSGGYTYSAPAIIKTQPIYTGPLAPIGQDGRVIDTEEVAKLKAEHLATLEKANAAAAAFAAASGYSMSSSEGYTYNAPAVIKTQQVYTGPLAHIGQDGRVIDTEEVAKLKAEHLATLEKANAAAAAFAAASGYSMSSSEGYTYNAPAIVKTEQVYNGPLAPLGKDGRVIDTEEVAKLKAEHLAALDQANAAAAAFAAASGSSMSTFSSEGYTYNAPIVHDTEKIAVEAPVIKPHQVYNGPPAPLGQDGRVIDTEEVAKLKAEHLAALDKANAAAAAFATASGSSMSTFSSEGYTYVAPAVQHTETFVIDTPVIKPHQVYNGPSAPLGQDGRVIDTEEVAKLKAEHLAALDQANAAAAAFATASGSSMSTFSSEGYTYNAPIVHDTEMIAVEAPVIEPHQVYNGPPAPLGQDGRVIDTEEVAKLKAEHLAALDKANAAAAAFAAASGSSMSTFSSEGYTYVAPVVHHTETIAIKTPVAKPHQFYNGPPAPLGEDGRVIDTEEVSKLKTEHLATLNQAHAEASAFEATSSSSSSSEGHSYEASIVPATTYGSPATTYGSPATTYGSPATTYGSPASTYGSPSVQHTETIIKDSSVVTKPHHHYNGPPAPIGEDGRVIDTEEVSKLKAEHLATLNQAHAAAATFEATSSSSSSSENYSYEAPIVPAATYGAPATVHTFAIIDAPAVTKPQKTYGGPLAPLSDDGQVVDTNEVAQLKAEHLATLAQANANAEASAATASSSSSAEIIYGAPVVQQVQTFVAVPIAKPSTYYGPPAPLSEDGQVIDTDEVARLKADHLATLAEATSKAVADASVETAEKSETVVYSPSLPAVDPLPSFITPVAEFKAATPIDSHALVQRVVRRRPAYTGPLAPLGANGRVVDTEEVAKLKAERLSTLKHATSYAIKLAHAEKTATSSAEIV